MTGERGVVEPPASLGDPWLTRTTREVYVNPWIRVREDEVTRPDGAPGIYGVVELRSTALGVVPVFPDATTVLVGQHRYPLGEWSWEIPEGGGALDREPQAEIARELREETGLTARRWTALGPVTTSNSVTDERGLLWLGEDLMEGTADPEPTEVLVPWRLPLADAVAMALDGRIPDAMSVVGLLRADAVLRARAS